VIHLLVGFVAGVLSSLLPGACNVAVIAAACRAGVARATATGVGIALGDTVYATLGALGVGSVIHRYPCVPPLLRAISGAVALFYGLALARTRPAHASAPPRAGILAGLALIAANPAALLTWILVAGALGGDASNVVGIGAGSAVGYAALARVAGHRSPRTVRIAGAVLVAFGASTLIAACVSRG
jgi:amino acid exporter